MVSKLRSFAALCGRLVPFEAGRLRPWLLIGMALTVSACGGSTSLPTAPTPTTVTLTGVVKNSSNAMIQDATITILDGVNAGKSVTSVNGAYRFDGLTVGNGNLSAVAIGYQESRIGVYINGSNTLDFVLEPLPPVLVSLTGTVKSNTGSPLSGATVTILDGVNAGRTTTTDATGHHKFDNLAVGNGNVSASANGYRESRIEVYINGSNTLDFVLEPLPPVLVSLTGTVKSNTGSPLSGATVKILDGVNAGKPVTTVSGAYRFDGLTAGNANLSAKAVGYEEARAGVHIDGVNTLNFVLRPEVIDPNGSWVGNGTGIASDGTPVSISVELKVAGGEVDTWTVRYSFPNSPGFPSYFPYGCSSGAGSQRNVPIINNSFEDRRFEIEVNNSLLYTPTIKGTFSSSTAVTGVVTLVKTTPDKRKECPASATVNWSGTKR